MRNAQIVKVTKKRLRKRLRVVGRGEESYYFLDCCTGTGRYWNVQKTKINEEARQKRDTTEKNKQYPLSRQRFPQFVHRLQSVQVKKHSRRWSSNACCYPYSINHLFVCSADDTTCPFCKECDKKQCTMHFKLFVHVASQRSSQRHWSRIILAVKPRVTSHKSTVFLNLTRL